MNLIGELIEVISRRAGLGNVREVGESLKTGRRRSPDDGPVDDAPSRQRIGDLLDVLGSDLLDFGQLVIEGMKKTTGQGDPDTGARFAHAHTGFNKVGETLRSAGPTERWEGTGSRAYADQNTRQQMRSEGMADADLEVHRVLFREAAQITLRRGFLDDQSNFLAYTSYATFPLQFIPRYGEAAKLAIELSALQGALGISAYQLYQLHSEVSANATELRQAVGRYAGVADNAETLSASTDFAQVPALSGGDFESDVIAPPSPPIADGGPVGGGSSGGAGLDAPGSASTCAVPPQSPMPVMPAPPAPPASMPTAPGGASPATGTASAGNPLGALFGSLAALVTSAAIAAGQQTAEERARDEENLPEGDDRRDGATDTDEQVATGAGAERAPLESTADPGAPQSPLTTKLNTDTSPVPPAGTSPQDTK